METISLKLEDQLLKDIDKSFKKYRYSTRTEFIRDAIRSKITRLEKDEIIRKLTALKGSLKGKRKNISDEEAREAAWKEIAKQFDSD